jgi:hypothetical protein
VEENINRVNNNAKTVNTDFSRVFYYLRFDVGFNVGYDENITTPTYNTIKE